MDIKQIRQLLRESASVVLVEEGHLPLIVKELPAAEQPQEVPISARWPKARPPAQSDGEARPNGRPAPVSSPSGDFRGSQDSVLERLNNEILALKEQIAQEEADAAGK